MKKLMTLLVCLAFVAVSAYAQKEQAAVQTGPKMSGYIFGDYFYKIGADTGTALTGIGNKSQYNTVKKDEQAFQIRRMYLFFDYTFNEQFAGRILIENNDAQFNSDSRFSFFMKQAYLEWKEIYPGAKLMVGLISTPEWAGGIAEKGWTYRSIEKTILDKSGLGTGADLGAAIYGKFDKEGNYGYSLMIGNGTGTKVESNKYKKYYYSAYAQPIKGLNFEVYGDFEPADKDLNKSTIKAVAYYQTPSFTVGGEFLRRTAVTATTPSEINVIPLGISAYATYTISDNFKVFGRFDTYDPNTEVTTAGYKENFITAGLDYMPIPNIHIMPNIWMTTFGGKDGVTYEKAADVVGRLTFFVNFK